MNIVLIGPYCPYRGGIADTNQELCETLQKQGHSVEILTFKLLYPKILFPGKTQYNKASQQNNKAKRVINSINPFNWIKTSKIINDISPDLVISCYWTPFLSLCLLFINNHINNKIKKIGLVHNAISREKNLFQKDLFKLYLRSIDNYVTFSKFISNEIIKIDQSKNGITLFHPIPKKFGNPIKKKLAKAKLGLKDNISYLTFFGLIREYKGLDLLIKSMVKISKKKSNVKLLIVGENYESLNKYKNLIKKNHLENEVIFINNFIDQDNVKYWFCSSDLIIQPYKIASQSGITPLALQFEIPTVCTNVGGLSEIILNEKDGFLCNPNVEDLEKKILTALDYNQDILKAQIKIKKKKLSWDSFVTQLMNNIHYE